MPLSNMLLLDPVLIFWIGVFVGGAFAMMLEG
jgi:hypothetical protein